MNNILKNQPPSSFRGRNIKGGYNVPPPVPHTTTSTPVLVGLTGNFKIILSDNTFAFAYLNYLFITLGVL